MATATTTYKFKKPAQTDCYNIDDQNQNWDKTEAAIKAETNARTTAINNEASARVNADSAESARLTIELNRLTKRYEVAGINHFITDLGTIERQGFNSAGAVFCSFSSPSQFATVGNIVWNGGVVAIANGVRNPAISINYSFQNAFRCVYFYLYYASSPNATISISLSFDNGNSWQSLHLIQQFNVGQSHRVGMYKLLISSAKSTVKVKLDAYAESGESISFEDYGIYPDMFD